MRLKRNLKHNYRVSEYEDRIIRNKAQRAKTSVSAYVRKAALQKDIIVIEGLREAMRELHAIGNNLNQQTIIMRQNGGYSPHIVEMKTSFCRLVDALNEKLKGGDGDSCRKDYQSTDREDICG